ncbi:histidine kinase [Pseudoxanthomonas sp. JBR18]|uniref:sensor histidine kinase n=1 Tax=Pseudoxanthomonas sp. JBR18 TaxID=2969308 RepID=UPI0023052034|nr:histidine kinase [Pseudoxanthomonas sp. JBR18]WCE05773.1 histidine kinase [Pseudoxanthomonas sp. JBR18]
MNENEVVRRLLEPLSLAGYFALGAVALVIRYLDTAASRAMGWVLLAAFGALFVLVNALPQSCTRGRLMWAASVPMPLLALALIAVDPRPGVAPVLLVIWIAVAMGRWPRRALLPAAVAANVGFYLILRHAGFGNPLTVVLINASFQVFAALCVHYAISASQARDTLALVNADLLATRALLADSARDAERLRVARELHDVAGHKLTAMKLNLRALAGDPVLAGRSEVRIAQQLSAELLDDIRNVVQALRDTGGLDLETALRALAAPLPRPALALDIAPEVTVSDPALAETLLRVVQEALTNTARHTEADTLHVQLRRDGNALLLCIEDNGQRAIRLREGNGLAGMRERIAAAHGTLQLDHTPTGALRLTARMPA